jgi:hypothetical protein
MPPPASTKQLQELSDSVFTLKASNETLEGRNTQLAQRIRSLQVVVSLLLAAVCGLITGWLAAGSGETTLTTLVAGATMFFGISTIGMTIVVFLNNGRLEPTAKGSQPV